MNEEIQHTDVVTSPEIGAIVEALAKAQLGYDKITRDAVNPYYKSKYTTLDEIIRATRPALANNGLVLLQFVTGDHNLVTVISRLAHTSGQWIESRMACKPSKPDIQQLGVIATYSKRYAMAAMLGVSADEDDDGNAAVFVSEEQLTHVKNLIDGHDDIRARLIKAFKALDKIPLAQYDDIVAVIKKNIADKEKNNG